MKFGPSASANPNVPAVTRQVRVPSRGRAAFSTARTTARSRSAAPSPAGGGGNTLVRSKRSSADELRLGSQRGVAVRTKMRPKGEQALRISGGSSDCISGRKIHRSPPYRNSASTPRRPLPPGIAPPWFSPGPVSSRGHSPAAIARCTRSPISRHRNGFGFGAREIRRGFVCAHSGWNPISKGG